MAVEHRPPTTRERLLETSRDELAPHRSLEAVADASGRVVGAVCVAATLVSALGLVSATTLLRAGWGWALPTVVLSATSAALAIWATVPWRASVYPGDLEDVRRFFDDQIKRRGRLVQTAGIAFGLAVLLAPLPALAAARWSSRGASLVLSAARHGADLGITVEGEGLAPNAVVAVTWGTGGAGGLLVDTEVGSAGRVSATAEVPLAALRGALEVRLVERAGAHVIAARSIAVPAG